MGKKARTRRAKRQKELTKSQHPEDTEAKEAVAHREEEIRDAHYLLLSNDNGLQVSYHGAKYMDKAHRPSVAPRRL